MKKFSIFYRIILLGLLFALPFTSCDNSDPLGPVVPPPPEKPDPDPDPDPEPTVEVTHTIAALKKKYIDAEMPEMYTIEEEIVIGGVVISTDETGNIHKELYLQDESAGIVVRLDKSDLYKSYPIGKKLYIKAKGMQMGNYRGMIQLGGKYNDQFGRLEEARIKDHVVEGVTDVQPNPFALDLTKMPVNMERHYGTWVKVSNVMFAEEEYQLQYTAEGAPTSRTLITSTGESIIVRTSNYASFAKAELPDGSGSVSGILSIHNEVLQLFLNTTEDVNLTGDRFDDPNAIEPPAGDGSLSDAFNISAGRANQGDSEKKWVKGYIVGYFKNNTFYPGTEAALNSNLAIADNKDETNPAKVMPVQLMSNSFPRTNLNLLENPEMLGQAVWLHGSLQTYYNLPGLKEVDAYSLDGINEEGPDKFQGELDPIYGADLTATMIDFRTYNVQASEEFWKAEAGVAKINAYQKGITGAWMISSQKLDLTGFTNPELALTEILNYFTAFTDVRVVGSTDYSGMGDPSLATWNDLTVVGDRFKNGENTTNFTLTEAMYIAFVYTSAEAQAMSWDIKTVEIVEGNTTPDPDPDPVLPTEIQNGGFETWTDDFTPEGWTKFESLEKEAGIVHTGSFSVKHTGAGGTKDLAQTISVQEGMTYEITFWYYVDPIANDGEDSRIWSVFKDAGDSNLADGHIKGNGDEEMTNSNPSTYLPSTPGQWVEFKKTYVAPVGATQLYFELRTYKNSIVYYDEISIVQQ
ncbi:DUF5689 domain-containing protein [Rapidithrix thailandica]|uniref:DUF5689 domain-containing protein n=1 Tax=Rapidithrix thailandica TaxID=413964 RepID=A0AAW9SHQ8_9BACT